MITAETLQRLGLSAAVDRQLPTVGSNRGYRHSAVSNTFLLMLSSRQPWIERNLTNRHLNQGTLILYDVTSTYLEGKQCALTAFGHNRDAKRGKMQIVYGVLCPAEGYPVAVEVFSGNTDDPRTLASVMHHIREILQPVGLDWISALRNADLRKLL